MAALTLLAPLLWLSAPADGVGQRWDRPLVEAIQGRLPTDSAMRVEVRSQYAALTTRPAGQPVSPRLVDRIATAEVRTDIYRSSAGRAYSVSGTISMQAAVPYESEDYPPDFLVVGLGQLSATGCVADSYMVGRPDYDTVTYSFSGYFADGTAAPPPATLWTCATAYTANDANADGTWVGDPALDLVYARLGNTMGSESLAVPGSSKRKVVKKAWTGLAVPVLNQGNVPASRVRLTARAKGARIRVNRVLASLDVGETDYIPIEVKLTGRTGRITFTVTSADGSASSGKLALAKAKPPPRPTVGKYQSTAGGDVRWKVSRTRKLSGFTAPLNIYCDGNLNPTPGTFKVPAFRVPRHGVVTKTVRDGIFTNELYLTIRGDNVPYGYFARYTDGLLTGQPACSGYVEFTAKWVGR
jgi:hypothetical protein